MSAGDGTQERPPAQSAPLADRTLGAGLGALAVRNLLRRPARVVVLVAAILLVATGFAFLTSQVQTTQILVRSTLNKNFRPAYDLLVLPPKAETSFERTTGLIDENYLSGLFGGISQHQLAQVKSVRGVSLAAPIAMVGYVELTTAITVPLRSVEANTPDQVFSVTTGDWVAENGLSRYPPTNDQPYKYYYYTTDPLTAVKATAQNPNGAENYPAQVVPGAPAPARVCTGFPESSGPERTALACESPNQPPAPTFRVAQSVTAARGTGPTAIIRFSVPVLLAAVTPKAEDQLVGLKRAMVSGRYLKRGEGESAPVPVSGTTSRFKSRQVPVIVSDKTYLDQYLEVTLDRLVTPTGTALVSAMTRPSAYALVTRARPAATKTLAIPMTRVYKALLGGSRFYKGNLLVDGVSYFYTTSPTAYHDIGSDWLRAVAMSPGTTTWKLPSNGLFSCLATGCKFIPPGGHDTAFRHVYGYVVQDSCATGVCTEPILNVVGSFDPTKLARFSTLSHVPLQTFYPPIADGANKKSTRLLRTRPVGPTTDIAGFLSEPPLLLTTLQAAKPFLDQKVFSHTGYSTTRLGMFEGGFRKPISAIQVRVSGLSGANGKSFQRLRDIAVAIERKTGLTVEVTAGSSPTNVTIDVPAGKFGRPALQLAQGWVKTSTAAVLLRGIDKESLSLWALLLLLLLLLVVCALFVGNAVVADLRGRRKELATLVTMGWTKGELTRLALVEVAAIGVVAGLSGTVLAVVLVEGFGLHLTLADTLLVTPAALVLALLAGTGPVLRATRSVGPLELARTPPAETAVRRSVGGITALALSGVWRRRGRSALGLLTLSLGVGAATYLVGIETAFHGEVVGTLLGNNVDLQVRGADLLALILMAVVAVGVVADLSYLSLKEREPQLAALRAAGWTTGDVGRLVATEAFVVALFGGVVGAAIGYGVLDLLHAPADAAVPTAVGALVAGVVLALISSLVPVTWWRKAPLSQRLVEP